MAVRTLSSARLLPTYFKSRPYHILVRCRQDAALFLRELLVQKMLDELDHVVETLGLLSDACKKEKVLPLKFIH